MLIAEFSAMYYILNIVSKCRFFFICKHSPPPKRSWKICHGVLEKSWIFLSVKEWEPCTVNIDLPLVHFGPYPLPLHAEWPQWPWCISMSHFSGICRVAVVPSTLTCQFNSVPTGPWIESPGVKRFFSFTGWDLLEKSPGAWKSLKGTSLRVLTSAYVKMSVEPLQSLEVANICLVKLLAICSYLICCYFTLSSSLTVWKVLCKPK